MLSLWGTYRCLIGLQFTETNNGQKTKKDGHVRGVRPLLMGHMNMALRDTYVIVMSIFVILEVRNLEKNMI